MYIYIHIPFCPHICSYCDFPKLLYNKKYIQNYLASLKKEIISRYKNEPVESIYIGGGTPTSLDYNELEELLNITNLFNKSSNLEFSIESNVELLTPAKIKLLKKYQVNRVSLGVQSFQPEILQELNRNHTYNQTAEVIKNLKKENIYNISIDLIYGVNSDINIIKKDLNTYLDLDIPHLSYYSLIIEENTIFGIRNREYINEDIEYKMYKYITKTLISNDYIHYETSNYCKKGYESRHNLNYWNNGSYYGFGLGAVSYINKERQTNTKNLTKYLKNNYIENIIKEDKNLQISNSLILGFRKIKGINILEFNKKYNTNILNLYNIAKLLDDNKLLIKDNYIYINPKYYYLSNEILINFV